jgi:hypothetical protein
MVRAWITNHFKSQKETGESNIGPDIVIPFSTVLKPWITQNSAKRKHPLSLFYDFRLRFRDGGSPGPAVLLDPLGGESDAEDKSASRRNHALYGTEALSRRAMIQWTGSQWTEDLDVARMLYSERRVSSYSNQELPAFSLNMEPLDFYRSYSIVSSKPRTAPWRCVNLSIHSFCSRARGLLSPARNGKVQHVASCPNCGRND